MKQAYLLFLKCQFSKKTGDLLKQNKFIFEINPVTSEMRSVFKNYYVFQVKSINQKKRGILCFGEYFMVHTSEADNYSRELMDGLDNADFYIAAREKLVDNGRKLYYNDATEWLDMINKFFLFDNVTQVGLYYTHSGVDNPFSTIQLGLSEMHMDNLLGFGENTFMLINKSC